MARADDSFRVVLLPHARLQARSAMTSITEIAMITGERYRIEGDPKDIEQIILDAARGSIMQLAWLVEAETGEDLVVNPEFVVTLRAVGS
jgi:hypothetical protein